MNIRTLFIVLALITARTVSAAPEARIIPAALAPSNEETLVRFVQMLQPTPEDDIFVEPILADQLGPGTHLRIQYQSRYMLPIEVVPMGGGAPDLLSAVLPAAEEGDVLIGLTRSSSWTMDMEGVILKLYGLNSAPPVINRLSTENHLSFVASVFSILRHPFAPEGFSYYVMSELAGYRIMGMSLTKILGVLLVLAVGAMLQRRIFHRKILMLVLGILLLYQARFIVDLSRYTFALERSWIGEEHTLGHMGTVYAIAGAVSENMRENDDALLLCTDMISTPLRYLVHPTPVHLHHSLLPDAVPTHAVTVRTWNEALSSFTCGNLRFSGSLLTMFPDGKALVHIQPPSS